MANAQLKRVGWTYKFGFNIILRHRRISLPFVHDRLVRYTDWASTLAKLGRRIGAGMRQNFVCFHARFARWQPEGPCVWVLSITGWCIDTVGVTWLVMWWWCFGDECIRLFVIEYGGGSGGGGWFAAQIQLLRVTTVHAPHLPDHTTPFALRTRLNRCRRYRNGLS